MITLIYENNSIHVFIDSDAIQLMGYSRNDMNNTNNFPFWKLIGFSNAYAISSDNDRMTDILKCLKIECENLSSQSIQNHVVPQMLSQLNDYYNSTNKNLTTMNSSLILFENEKMFIIDPWFVVNQIKAPYCIGESSKLFETSLNKLKHTELLERIKLTYSTYSDYRNYSPKMVHHITIKDDHFDVEHFSLFD